MGLFHRPGLMLRVLLGVPFGLALWFATRYADRALERYSHPKFEDYTGPKMYRYHNGVRSIWNPEEEAF